MLHLFHDQNKLLKTLVVEESQSILGVTRLEVSLGGV